MLDIESGRQVASASSPDVELEIRAPHPGWAEQDPQTWWECVKDATKRIGDEMGGNLHDVEAIGISYQMHGLVIVDERLDVLRPAIIWCDSRAVDIGEEAAERIGRDVCLKRLLNFPGNFTASKLAWVKRNEPEVFAKIYKMMLPGEYIAMRLTGDVVTTPSGLSEGILWDYTENDVAGIILDAYGIDGKLLPDIKPIFGMQGEVTKPVADELGLKAGTPVAYRAGDQPNNALSLNVLNPGEVAATAGTSGVIYAVTDNAVCDPQSRVNTFVHVTHTDTDPRYGVLMCINGTGILNRWMRYQITGSDTSYEQMNEWAMDAPVGSEGLIFLPYGNGAERTLGNRDIGASLHGLNFNIHNRSHMLRAAQEGIVFSLNYGFEIMSGMGIQVNAIRAGHANMFLSPLFAEAFANTVGVAVELYDTDGAQGAARGAGIGAGIFADYATAFKGLEKRSVIEPGDSLRKQYLDAYNRWRDVLASILHER